MLSWLPTNKALMLHSMVASPRFGAKPEMQFQEMQFQNLGGNCPADGISRDWRQASWAVQIQDLGDFSSVSYEAQEPRKGGGHCPVTSKPCPLRGEDVLHLLSAVFLCWKSAARLWVARPRAKFPVLSES